MQDHIRVMYIHFHVRKLIQDPSTKLCIHFHGFHRKTLIDTTGHNFECHGFITIHFLHIIQHSFRKCLKPVIFCQNHRTDSHNTEDSLQRFNGLIIVKASFCLHIDTTLFSDNMKCTVSLRKYFFHAVHQCIFKYVTVLAFYADLTVFN